MLAELAPTEAQGRAGQLEVQARRQIVLARVSALEPTVARISELTIQIRRSARLPR